MRGHVSTSPAHEHTHTRYSFNSPYENICITVCMYVCMYVCLFVAGPQVLARGGSGVPRSSNTSQDQGYHSSKVVRDAEEESECDIPYAACLQRHSTGEALLS